MTPAEIEQANAGQTRWRRCISSNCSSCGARKPGDDLTTQLVQAEEDGSKLSNEELTANIILLFGAGHETTVNLIGNGLLALHRNPDQLALLKANPALIGNAIEEFLRYDSSVQLTGRVALEDIEDLGGRQIPKGESVLCLLGLGQPRSGGLSRPAGRGSTSPGPMCARCRSAAASTTASAPSWRGSRPRSRSRPCCAACRNCGSTTPRIRNGGRPSCCAASKGCPPAGEVPAITRRCCDFATLDPIYTLLRRWFRAAAGGGSGHRRGGVLPAHGPRHAAETRRAGTCSKGDAVQTTLLGLAIALIVALMAALIGPYFIDWNQFRPQFEAEATRVLGAPVRVGGQLDARLLPTPSLRLRSVVVGGANDLGRVRADKLDVEFSLGSLMRGEWRATELTINGMALDLGLDPQGRIDWPASTGKFSLGTLAIDRLNLTGRVALHDAASRSTLELNDIAFSGDVRSLAGAVRGDGNFTMVGNALSVSGVVRARRGRRWNPHSSQHRSRRPGRCPPISTAC